MNTISLVEVGWYALSAGTLLFSLYALGAFK